RHGEFARDDVRVRLDVFTGCADVDPVRVALERVKAAATIEHAGERLTFDRHGQPGWYALEHRRFEHICARVDPVAWRLVPGWLRDERDDFAVSPGRHNPERRRVGDAAEMDRGFAAVPVVEPDHLGEVERREHVAVAYDKAFVDARELGCVADPARGPQ